jgi:hypothetical protein
MSSMSVEWKFVGHAYGMGPFLIDGVDLFKHKWNPLGGARATIRDPAYGQAFDFEVWEVVADEKRIVFAAGEF